MNYREIVSERLRPLANYPYLSTEFYEDSFSTVMENRNPTMLGHFAGGDMAYIANAAAAAQCAAEGVFAQSASINVECIAKGDGEVLVANAEIVHMGKKMIRTRCKVYARKNGEDSLVAIAQVNLSPLADKGKAIYAADVAQSP